MTIARRKTRPPIRHVTCPGCADTRRPICLEFQINFFFSSVTKHPPNPGHGPENRSVSSLGRGSVMTSFPICLRKTCATTRFACFASIQEISMQNASRDSLMLARALGSISQLSDDSLYRRGAGVHAMYSLVLGM